MRISNRKLLIKFHLRHGRGRRNTLNSWIRPKIYGNHSPMVTRPSRKENMRRSNVSSKRKRPWKIRRNSGGRLPCRLRYAERSRKGGSDCKKRHRRRWRT